MSVVTKVSQVVNKVLKPLDNKVLGTTVRVALILYASLIAPELPDVVARQLDNLAIRSVLIFLIAYMAVKDPVTAGLATLALMVTVMSLHRRDVQGVLGKAVSLTEKPVSVATGVVGKVVDVAEDVAEGAFGAVSGILGYNGAQVEEKASQMQAPSGVESGMDDAGSL